MFPIYNSLLRKNVRLRLRTFTSSKHENEKTASVIVIGDEVLKGLVADTNSHFVCKEFYRMGVSTKKIVVLGDNIDIIADEIKEHASKYDYVITTGGIGPTHDDVTFEAAAKAFDENLVLNPILKKICNDYFTIAGLEKRDLKMAFIPKSAKLTFGIDPQTGSPLRYPNISIKNVYMFPGIPQFMEKSFSSLSSILFTSTNKFYLKTIYLNVPEFEVITELNSVVREFPTVLFGSYPEVQNGRFKVKITIESTDKKFLDEAHNRLKNILPPNSIVEVTSQDEN